MNSKGTCCCLCGTGKELHSRYVSCGSESESKDKTNGQETTVSTHHDIQLWNLTLCQSCISKSIDVYLSKHIKEATKKLTVMVVMIIMGVAAGFWVYLQQTGSFKISPGGSNVLWALMITAGFLAGFIGLIAAPFYLWSLVGYNRKRRNSTIYGSISSEGMLNAFKEAGQEVLDTMVSSSPEITNRKHFQYGHQLPQATDKPKSRFLILGAGETPEAAVPIKWAEIYAKREEIPLNSVRDNISQESPELASAARRTMIMSFITFGILAASSIIDRYGYNLASALMRTPGAVFLGITAFFFWLYTYDQFKEYSKAWGHHPAKWRTRFWLFTMSSAFIVLLGVLVAIIM